MNHVSEVAARLTRPQKSIGCEDVSEVATWTLPLKTRFPFLRIYFSKLSSCMYASARLELRSQGLHFCSISFFFWIRTTHEGTTISLIVCQRCGSEKCNSDYPSGPPVKKNAPHSQTLFKACSEYLHARNTLTHFGFAIVPPTSLQQDRYCIKSQGCEWRR
ncbi:uncharacterized protein EI90DRAFT_3085798 [Cantharellus anzutake]|uniref:uncharacterized protein n=1 Tax=Cantharellus anzutake TaxID=1750568 RepID=UPI0019086C7D|nr:uncharacterized protein EI90DRAFT_3085798 [Cantharellus anzutake]KAF8316960.1 hypothetical protein EI90DRAFT_3085798 [Cantharellus anzutake]